MKTTKLLTLTIFMLLLALPFIYAQSSEVIATNPTPNAAQEYADFRNTWNPLAKLFDSVKLQAVLDGVDYDCTTPRVHVTKTGITSLTITHPANSGLNWVRWELVSSSGFHVDGSFLGAGISTTVSNLVASNTYVLDSFACNPKTTSGSGSDTGTGSGSSSGGSTSSDSSSAGSTNTGSSKQLDLQIISRADQNDITIDSWSGLGYDAAQLLSAQAGIGDIVKVKVKNTGTETLGGLVEAFFVSKTNPFAVRWVSNTCANQLQSVFGISGIDRSSNTLTCKGDLEGNTYTIDPLVPGEEKIFFIYVKHPNPQAVLAGTSLTGKNQLEGQPTYNSNEEYLLVVNLLDDCTQGNLYDTAGATFNYKTFCTAENTSSDPNCIGCDHTYDGVQKQLSLTKQEYDEASPRAILAASCDFGSDCESKEGYEIRCVSNDETKDKNKKAFESDKGWLCSVGTSDISIGGVVKIAAYTLGLSYYCNAQDDKIPTGTCIATPEEESGSIVENIGASVNGFFGGSFKTGISDENMGYLIIAVIIIIFIAIIIKR